MAKRPDNPDWADKFRRSMDTNPQMVEKFVAGYMREYQGMSKEDLEAERERLLAEGARDIHSQGGQRVEAIDQILKNMNRQQVIQEKIKVDPRETSLQRQRAIDSLVKAFNNPTPLTRTVDNVREEIRQLEDKGVTTDMFDPLSWEMGKQQRDAEMLWVYKEAIRIYEKQSK